MMPAEENKLQFDEPYLLAMAANADGQTGCQFFVTLEEMPSLNGTCNTIFGRLVKGKETLGIVEGLSEFRKIKLEDKLH